MSEHEHKYVIERNISHDTELISQTIVRVIFSGSNDFDFKPLRCKFSS